MARKGQVGIDYFSHDVDMLSDRKIKLLKAKHGLIGYAVYLRLLEELYQDKGYYLEINEDFNILFSDDNNLDLNVYILILNDCINHELFDIKIFEKYSILTSKRIQINYLTACERRKGIDIYSEYLLFDMEDANIKTDNVNILNLNVDIGAQIKKKVKKEEKDTEKTELEKAIDDFLEFRSSIKKPLKTKKSIDILIQSLNKLSDDEFTKIEILNQSILNGWQGIFPLKNNINKQQIQTASTTYKDDNPFNNRGAV